MSRRSPFWQSFTARTPLGYSTAGYFSTEPGPAYGTIRFTHVDGPLKRPYTSPPVPVPLAPYCLEATLDEAREAGTGNLHILERPDGTTVAFYPLYDADGALVEVVPRTRDTVVIADTAWRPLAGLVRAARHAGMEEAVRRLRAVLVFTLEGSDNPRIVRHAFANRLTLVAALPGTGRARAPYSQLRSWAGQYGLDLPDGGRELDGVPEADAVLKLITNPRAGSEFPGAWSSSGVLVAVSSRAGAELVDLPADNAGSTVPEIGPIAVWDAMARMADRGETPAWDHIVGDLKVPAGDNSRGPQGTLAQAWQQWAACYPEAFAAADRIAG